MSIEFNRAARRKQERKARNRKSGMVALSVMATTSLMSSYVSLLRTEPSFAGGAPIDCSTPGDNLALSVDVSRDSTQDVIRIQQLQVELYAAISEGTERCVTVTFLPGPGAGEDVLNFTNGYDRYGLEMFYSAEGNNPKIIFIGNDVTFDFSTYEGSWSDSPIRTDLEFEIHDITFQNSFVSGEGAYGGVINAEDNLSIYDSQFLSNTVYRGDGGAVFAGNNAVISNTTFRANTAEGGAIGAGQSASSEGGNGGALIVRNSATITQSTFEDNEAKGFYDYFDGGAPGKEFYDCSGGSGGAVWALSEVTITDSYFYLNSAIEGGDYCFGGDGGAVYLAFAAYSSSDSREGGSLVSGSTFEGNHADQSGGAFFINRASEDGGFSRSDGASILISDSDFILNFAGDFGGAIYSQNPYGDVVSSTFTNNQAVSQGGAIMFRSPFSNVSLSTFDGNFAGQRGGAIMFDSFRNHVSSSTFDGNSAVDIVDNRGEGGAIHFRGTNNQVETSTFLDNTANYGGALYFNDYDDVNEVSNSTFVGNSAENYGGAIYAPYGTDIVFNTFLDNESDTANSANTRRAFGDSLLVGEGDIVGNIFAGDSEYPQIRFLNGNDRPDEMTYNLSTGNDFAGIATNSPNVSLINLALDTQLKDNETVQLTQTLSLDSTSAAFGAVPQATAEKWLSDDNPNTTVNAPRDQRGVLRLAEFVNAGAFEGYISLVPDETAPTVSGSATVNRTAPTTTVATYTADESVQTWSLSGANSGLFNIVGGVVTFKTASVAGTYTITVEATDAAGNKGTLNVTVIVAAAPSGGGGDTVTEAPAPPTAAVIPQKAVVPGFGSNSTKLTKAMKNEIKAFVEANPGLNTVTCKGFTSAPATRQDLRLAKQRGQATCDYIKTLNPQLEVKVLPGAHTNAPGQKVRRVRIEMN